MDKIKATLVEYDYSTQYDSEQFIDQENYLGRAKLQYSVRGRVVYEFRNATLVENDYSTQKKRVVYELHNMKRGMKIRCNSAQEDIDEE